MMIPAPSRLLSIATLGATLITVACGGRGGSVPAPSDPEITVREFMNAVRANRLRTMGALWGTARGPAAGSMPAAELEQRLTVMRIYLEHERYELVPDSDAVGSGGRRVLRLRLFRKGCTSVVPFTLVRYRDGWLISEIDLAAAGNPARICAERR